MSNPNQFILKFCFVGTHSYDFARNIATSKFDPRNILHIDIGSRIISLDNYEVKLILISMKSTPFFPKSYLPSFYQGSYGLVFLFDKSDRSSFDNIPLLVDESKKFVKDDVPSVIVGLSSDSEVVSFDQAQALADRLGFSYYESTVSNIEYNLDICRTLARKSFTIL